MLQCFSAAGIHRRLITRNATCVPKYKEERILSRYALPYTALGVSLTLSNERDVGETMSLKLAVDESEDKLGQPIRVWIRALPDFYENKMQSFAKYAFARTARGFVIYRKMNVISGAPR